MQCVGARLEAAISLYDLRTDLNLARDGHFFKGGMRQHNHDCETELLFKRVDAGGAWVAQ